MDDLCAIDFGTGYTSFSFADGTGNPEVGKNEAGELQTESVFFYPEEGEGVVIGSEARNLAALDPKKALFHPKRNLASDTVLVRCERTGREVRARDTAEAMFCYVAKTLREGNRKRALSSRCHKACKLRTSREAPPDFCG